MSSTLGAENALVAAMDEQMKSLAEGMNRKTESGKYELSLAERMKVLASVQDWLMKRRRLLGEEPEGDDGVNAMQRENDLLKQVARLKERLERYEPGDGGPPLPTYRPHGGRPSKRDQEIKQGRRKWLQDQGVIAPDPDPQEDSSELDKALAKLRKEQPEE